MAPFDRPYATFYSSAIVTIALSCTIFEFLTLNNIVTLKCGLEVIYYIHGPVEYWNKPSDFCCFRSDKTSKVFLY